MAPESRNQDECHPCMATIRHFSFSHLRRCLTSFTPSYPMISTGSQLLLFRRILCVRMGLMEDVLTG